MSTHIQPYQGKIAIIGGGISGVVLAIALLRRGLKVAIYEQAPKFGEIGAGVAFNPAATRAMKICSPDIYEVFEKVATKNQSPEKRNTWFDFLDGYNDTEVGKEEWLFKIEIQDGANSVHRAHFLDEMIHLLPEGITHFGKRFESCEETDDGKIRMKFKDGSEDIADALIGCDGIKSKVRAWMVGHDSPAANPQYTHKYAYRGLIPMERAREHLGDDLAQNAKMHFGQDGHVLTFPVDHGKVMNVVAFYTDRGEWPDPEHLTRHSEREHVQEDFKHFGATVKKIIELLEPKLDCWAIFDTAEHPVKQYNKGKVVLVGDAGHATSPHHGAGAGMCVEDVAIMVELLTDDSTEKNEAWIKSVFQAYNDQRLERTHFLTDSSRYSGEVYDWRSDLGRDFRKIEQACRERDEKLWNGQVSDFITEGKEILAKLAVESK